jgi:5-methylcytosine-specific restriction endonuclease McrA
MVSGQMTRGAAISMALLAIIVLALIVLLAWPTHSASHSPVDTDDLAGMVDPRVSQANIQVTICRRGWTRTVRPAREVTDAIKRNLVADRRVSPRDYELDHIVPLDLGGARLDLRNLMLQAWTGACNAHQKDALERQLLHRRPHHEWRTA